MLTIEAIATPTLVEVNIITASMDSELEVFSHHPTDDSFTAFVLSPRQAGFLLCAHTLTLGQHADDVKVTWKYNPEVTRTRTSYRKSHAGCVKYIRAALVFCRLCILLSCMPSSICVYMSCIS